MTRFHDNRISIDRNKLKYSIFYFPGTGGHIVAWMLALAHDYTLLSKALECFPLELKDNPKATRAEDHEPLSGWSFHENVQPENPYCKLVFLSVLLREKGHDLYRNNLDTMHKVTKIASSITVNIFLLMSSSARIRACFDKGSNPFRTYDEFSINNIKNEKIIYERKKLEVIRKFDSIDYLFSYNSIFYSPERYIGEIETIIDHPLTDAHTEAIEKLVNRYVQITPPKLLKIINDENKLS